MKEKGSPKTVSPLTPHFRKTVLSRTLSDNKLKIPKAFMKKYGSNISNPVLIKVPGGKGEWKMGLTDLDENGDAWLVKGWPEFAKHYDLEDGQSLFFKYKGHSQFKVVIIGKFGLEIDYPVFPSNTKDLNESDIEISREEEEEKEEDHDDDVSCPQKRIKRSPIDISGTFSSPQEIGSEELQICEAVGMNYGSMSPREKAKALSRTKDFKSLNPFFKVVIQETHLHDFYDLTIPPEFWVEHLNDKSGHFVTLSISNGEKWSVKINTTSIGIKEVRASFVKIGWKEFAVDNDLKIGDVCIFELIMSINEVRLKVSIYRNNLESQGESFVNTSNSKDGENVNVSCGRRSSTTGSSFNVELRDYSLFRLPVPKSFAKKHFDFKTSPNLKLQVGKKFWPVRLIVKSSARIYFSAGWRAFVNDNHLRIGDSCVFERVGNDEDELVILGVTVVGSNSAT